MDVATYFVILPKSLIQQVNFTKLLALMSSIASLT
jgi:hypothetical protein